MSRPAMSLTRRQFGEIASAAAAALRPANAAELKGSRPNILLLMTDQQRWDSIAGRTACRTPNINRLVNEGLRFERPYVTAAVCCPSRASLLTGQYSYHNGVFNQINGPEAVRTGPFPGVMTYSRQLRNAGYRLGYIGKWHVSWNETPVDFGFHDIAAPGSYNRELLQRLKLRREEVEHRQGAASKRKLTQTVVYPGNFFQELWGIDEGAPESSGAWFVADRAVQMIERYAALNQPWFITTNMNEPHSPFMPRPEFLRHYHPDDILLPPSFHDTFERKPDMHSREASLYNALSEKDVRTGIAHYYAYCEQLDAEYGRVLDALARSGQANNTLVIFASDHGEMCGDHHMYLKGWMPYEGCYRIPMAARWPGKVKPGSSCSSIVMLHDLAHTFVELAGADPIRPADGRSLVPLLADPAAPVSRDERMTVWHGAEFLYTQRMLIRRRYKYVFNGFSRDELYDLEKDPHELHNVAGDAGYRAALEQMQNGLYDAMTHVEDPLVLQGRMGAARYLPHPALRGKPPRMR
jgi:arylsulfatase A-like enzyme